MTQADGSKQGHLAQVRDSVESVYVAIILAFVLRAFMIEAFVIPTGSMANALYGDHYELTCPSCGWRYAYGRDRNNTYTMAQCPNCYCRYGSVPHPGKKVEPRGGDRVLVMKYLYDFSPLQPWDVVVFKNPQNNRENYIKRLIGLPGEGIQIIHGDIFVSRNQGKTWQIRRKPLEAQKAMWQIVHNADYPPSPTAVAISSADPPRWKASAGQSTRWNLKEYDGRVFSFRGGESSEAIRFDPGFGAFRPCNGYNNITNRSLGYDRETDICTDWKLSCVWRVESTTPAEMDMTFASFEDRFRATFQSDGTVRLLHQRRDAPQNDWEEWGRADVGAFTPPKGRRVGLWNVDYQVSVWVDGTCVLKSTDAQYAGASDESISVAPAERIYQKARNRTTLLERLRRTEQLIQAGQARLDRRVAQTERRQTLQTALQREKKKLERLRQEETWFKNPEIHLSARGGPLTLWHVNVQRDVFYTQSLLKNPRTTQRQDYLSDSPIFDYFKTLYQLQEEGLQPGRFKPIDEHNLMSWGSLGNPIFLKDHPGRDDLDEFFCLGDNSSQSHDGRSWEAAAPSLRLFDQNGNPLYQLGTVPRYNIIGRAMLVYWPAGFRLPILDWPIVPNVGRIRLIR